MRPAAEQTALNIAIAMDGCVIFENGFTEARLWLLGLEAERPKTLLAKVILPVRQPLWLTIGEDGA